LSRSAIVRLMTRRLAGLVLLLVAIGGCYQSRRPGEGGEGDAGDSGWGLPDAGEWPDGGQWWPDATPRDVGPACPDPGPPINAWECDILDQDCLPGLGCYGWIEYTEDPCIREIYRSACLVPGSGGHGDSCEDWCGPGLECFVTGEGTQCLYVCDIMGGSRRCPQGLICSPTDMPGIGACS
jgi:hypothetical protein